MTVVAVALLLKISTTGVPETVNPVIVVVSQTVPEPVHFMFPVPKFNILVVVLLELKDKHDKVYEPRFNVPPSKRQEEVVEKEDKSVIWPPAIINELAVEFVPEKEIFP